MFEKNKQQDNIILPENSENDNEKESVAEDQKKVQKTSSLKKILHRISAYLRLIHFKQIRGEKLPITTNRNHRCINCHNLFSGNYCNNCGQKANTSRLSKKSVLYNLFGGMSSINSGFLLTLKELITRPGYMINDFIAGKRVRYFRPFQTLFVLAAIYIVAAQLIDPDSLKIEMTNHPRINAEKVDELPKNLSLLYQFFHLKPIKTIVDVVKNWAKGNKASGILVMLPIFALATKWAFRKRRFNQHYNYIELLFAQTFIACQMLFVALFFLFFYGKYNAGSLFAVPTWVVFLLSVYTYKQLFRDSWFKSAKRTALMYFYSFVILLAVLISIALTAILITLVFHLVSGHSFSSFWTN